MMKYLNTVIRSPYCILLTGRSTSDGNYIQIRPVLLPYYKTTRSLQHFNPTPVSPGESSPHFSHPSVLPRHSSVT